MEIEFFPKDRHTHSDLIRLMWSCPPTLADLTQLKGFHSPTFDLKLITHPALADLTRLMGPHPPTLAD